MKINYYARLLVVFALSYSGTTIAQTDDWQKILMVDLAADQNLPVIATFKTTRIINAQSNETVKAHTLDFRITHRFGSVGKTYGGNEHNMYGLDAASDIRIGFEYGVTDRLTLGFGRSRRFENLQGLVKYRLMQQTQNNAKPFAITLYADAAYTPQKAVAKEYSNSLHRLAYTTEVIIAKKFGRNVSLQLMPCYVHRNYVPYFDDENDLLSVGIGGRIKFTKRSAFIFDYYKTFSHFRSHVKNYAYVTQKFYAPLGMGWELETGGHVFSIMFTNSSGIIESDYIPYTNEDWFKAGVRLGFNISRNFKI